MAVGRGVDLTPLMTCTVVEEPSVSSPRSSRMVSNAPASTASFFKSVFARSAVDLMSRRAQRMSCAVMAATPCSRSAAEMGSSALAKANTVGSSPAGQA
jgi:hypothetical protein